MRNDGVFPHVAPVAHVTGKIVHRPDLERDSGSREHPAGFAGVPRHTIVTSCPRSCRFVATRPVPAGALLNARRQCFLLNRCDLETKSRVNQAWHIEC